MDFSGSSGSSGDIDSQLEAVKQQVQAQMITKQLQVSNCIGLLRNIGTEHNRA